MARTRTRKRAPPPSKWWYAAAVIIALAGFAGAAQYMIPRLASLSETLIRLVAPGEIDLTLKEPGTYTIFHEKRSVIDGRLYTSNTISGLHVSVRSAQTNQEIPVVPASITETYTFGSYAGTSVFTFETTEPGGYRLVANYEDGRTEPRVALAIGHNFLGNLLMLIFGTLAIVFGSIAVAAAIIVIVAQKRATAANLNTR